MILLGDAKEQMGLIEDACVDLIVTSPPYANQRKKTYGGIPHDEYVDWFLPISSEMMRVLKPTGSFILNIKENVVKKERSTYVLELILALKKQGWCWTDEFVWVKSNSVPGKWSNRFRDGWERLLHFTKQHIFHMYQEAVMIPTSEATKKRIRNLKPLEYEVRTSATGSDFTRKYKAFIGRDMVYPDNVFRSATETRNVGHSAAFPEALPEYFIKLFTQEGDTVLDPFLGSGTTTRVAKRLNRKFIGIEKLPENFELAMKRTYGGVTHE